MIYSDYGSGQHHPWCQCDCERNGHPVALCDYVKSVKRTNGKFVCNDCLDVYKTDHRAYATDLVKIVMS